MTSSASCTKRIFAVAFPEVFVGTALPPVAGGSKSVFPPSVIFGGEVPPLTLPAFCVKLASNLVVAQFEIHRLDSRRCQESSPWA